MNSIKEMILAIFALFAACVAAFGMMSIFLLFYSWYLNPTLTFMQVFGRDLSFTIFATLQIIIGLLLARSILK